MSDQVKPDPKQAPTQDAELAAENIASGEEKAPTVDVSDDYEASKQFSVSDVDRSGAGAAAAKEATGSQFQVSQPQETKTTTESTGNPDAYRDMAAEVGSDVGSTDEAVTNVSDDLVDKALDMGKPG